MRTEPTEAVDVILSHAIADTALAEAVHHRLSELGIRSRSTPPAVEADDYIEQLRHVVEDGRSFVPLLTPSFVGSHKLLVEGGFAWAKELPIFGLCSESGLKNVPEFFRQFRTYTLWNGLPKLVTAVRKLPEGIPA